MSNLIRASLALALLAVCASAFTIDRAAAETPARCVLSGEITTADRAALAGVTLANDATAFYLGPNRVAVKWNATFGDDPGHDDLVAALSRFAATPGYDEAPLAFEADGNRILIRPPAAWAAPTALLRGTAGHIARLAFTSHEGASIIDCPPLAPPKPSYEVLEARYETAQSRLDQQAVKLAGMKAVITASQRAGVVYVDLTKPPYGHTYDDPVDGWRVDLPVRWAAYEGNTVQDAAYWQGRAGHWQGVATEQERRITALLCVVANLRAGFDGAHCEAQS